MKLPAFQFYPGDWRKDVGVQSLSYHDRGVWFEMLCLMHESPVRGKLLFGNKAIPDEVLAGILHLDPESLKSTIATLIERGVTERDPGTGALINRRMIRDEENRAKNRHKLYNWRKNKETKDNCNQNVTVHDDRSVTEMYPLPSSSSSSSSSSSIQKHSIKMECESIYEAYPRKVGRDSAIRAIAKALKVKPYSELLNTVNRYAEKVRKEGTEKQFIPHPRTWFNQGRYEDEDLKPVPKVEYVEVSPEEWWGKDLPVVKSREPAVDFEEPLEATDASH